MQWFAEIVIHKIVDKPEDKMSVGVSSRCADWQNPFLLISLAGKGREI